MKILEEHFFWTETNSQPSLKYTETELYHQLWPWSSFVKAYQNMHMNFGLYWLEERHVTRLRSK